MMQIKKIHNMIKRLLNYSYFKVIQWTRFKNKNLLVRRQIKKILQAPQNKFKLISLWNQHQASLLETLLIHPGLPL